MTTPSPFQVARETSNNLSSSFKRVKDENAIENILSQAMNTGNPEIIQSSIGQILSQVSPERQGAALQYLQGTFANLQKKKEQEQQFKREKDAGLVPGINPTAQAKIYGEQAKSGRLAQYGLGGQQAPSQYNLPNAQNGTPVTLQGGEQPRDQAQQQAPQSVFRNLNDDQLVQAQSHPDMEVRQGSAAEQKRREAERTINQKETKRTRDEELQFHKESAKYDEDLLKQTKTAKGQIETIGNIQKAIASGNVTPSSWANILKGFGKIGNKISEALINKDEATLLASIPQLLEGWKEVFGVRLSDADLNLLQDKLPSIGKSKEANSAILKIMKKYGDMTLLRSQIAKEIKEKNGGLRPLGYADKIESRFDEMVRPIRIIRPKTEQAPEREIEIPAYQLSDALRSGARLANE